VRRRAVLMLPEGERPPPREPTVQQRPSVRIIFQMNPAIGYLLLPFLTIRSRRGFPSRVAIVPGSVAETSLNFWKERLIKLKQGARQAHAERGRPTAAATGAHARGIARATTTQRKSAMRRPARLRWRPSARAGGGG